MADDISRNLYLEKTYAGVLGKIIGVYLGRPVEGWDHGAIMARFGIVSSYINEALGLDLVVTDDDISGTFTFVRALEDYGFDPALEPRAIGQTWLNYLVEGKTILWWGGRGTSTEHTAYLNLKAGIEAPASGSSAVNGQVTANQIGAMIFIDAWAMVSPNNPERAARLARAAASVSHDGEAVNAAVFLAVMESLAYGEASIEALLDAGLRHVPEGSAIARQVRSLRDLHGREGDWLKARAWLEAEHGYDRYPGTCHVLPNFSLILLALLYGQGDFRKSLSIVTTSGWDTDCNAANLACLLGIRNGLGAIEACPDLRLPPRDLIFLSSADGGRGLTDAAQEALRLANYRFALDGLALERPKAGARYSFVFPGSLQGFHALPPPPKGTQATLENRLTFIGTRALCLGFYPAEGPASMATPVFKPQGRSTTGSYDFQASPCLYPGQVVKALAYAGPENASTLVARPFVTALGAQDKVLLHYGPELSLGPGARGEVSWKVECGTDYPLLEVGFEVQGGGPGLHEFCLDRLDWSGVPTLTWGRTYPGCKAWKDAWVDGVDSFAIQFPESFHLSQNLGTGLISQGLREWRDYEVEADLVLIGAQAAGVLARVQGQRRYYGLFVSRDNKAQLVREKDGTALLAECPMAVEESVAYRLRLRVEGQRLQAWLGERKLFDLEDGPEGLASGAIGLGVTQGTALSKAVALRAL